MRRHESLESRIDEVERKLDWMFAVLLLATVAAALVRM